MTDKSIWLSPLAESDLENIWFYTADRWSIEQADSYYHDLVATFAALASGARRGHAVGLRPGYRKQACGAHMIYFREEDGAVAIIRILHARQDVDRHLS